MNNLADNSNPSIPVAAWLAEGQSSQRDMLESLQSLKSKSNKPFQVFASHRHDRPEIFEFADMVYREPSDSIIDTDIQMTDETAIPRWQLLKS